MARWRRRWFEEGLARLREGDLESALPMLKEARDFGGGLVPEVDLAVRQLTALEGALDAFESTCYSASRERAEPALTVLLEWAPELGREMDRKVLRDWKSHLEGRHARDWEDALRHMGRYRKQSEPGKETRPAEVMMMALRSLEGRFPEELVAELEPAVEAADWAAVERLLEAAPRRPLVWLVREHFGW